MLKAACLMSLVLENIYFTPRRALRGQLAGLRDFARSMGASRSTIDSFPKDPRPAAAQFYLDAVTRQFVSCTNCHHLYPFNPGDNPDSNSPSAIPMHCTSRKTPSSSPCDTSLWTERKTGAAQEPRAKFVYQDLKSWVGRLLSRKGMEDILDGCPKGFPVDPDADVDDIWSLRVFVQLKDHTGRSFLPGPPDEGRLVFGLATDSFDVFGMKTAKQTASGMGIWLVCMFLPPHLRYLQENLFLAGVVQGPEKPSKEAINPYLQLIVNDLLEFWTPGVFFSRTYRYRQGRLYRAMLVPLIADYLALRQMLGIPSAPGAHYFCTFCDLDIDDIDVLDRNEWPEKDAQHICRIAELWKNASSERVQDLIFQKYGVKYSPLIQLPYLDLVRYAIIESMHALDLNLFDKQCRQFFKLDLKVKGGDGIASASLKSNRKSFTVINEMLEKCAKIVRMNGTSLLDEILVLHRKVLYVFSVNHNIRGEGHRLIVSTRWVLASNIYRWVSLSGLPFEHV